MAFALELIESEAYSAALKAIGDPERLDDALSGVYWALATNPEVYEVVKGFKDIRILKTDPLGGVAFYECAKDGMLVLPPDGRLKRVEANPAN